MLILTQYISKHELKPLRKYFSVDDLVEGANKVVKGLGQQIKPAKDHKDFKFFKVRIGSSVKGRMIVFVVSSNSKVVPLLIRLKKDKQIGMNMAANNPLVADQVERNLAHVINDIENGKYEEFLLH